MDQALLICSPRSSERCQRPRSPPSRSLPPPLPPASSLILQAACQKGPRAQAYHALRRLAGAAREARPGGSSSRALCARPPPPPPQHFYVSLPRPGLPRPPRPAGLQPADLPESYFLRTFSPKSQPFHPVPTRTSQTEGQPRARKLTVPLTQSRARAHTSTDTLTTLCRPGRRQTAHFQGAPGPTPERSTRVRPSRAAKRRLQAHRRLRGG